VVSGQQNALTSTHVTLVFVGNHKARNLQTKLSHNQRIEEKYLKASLFYFKKKHQCVNINFLQRSRMHAEQQGHF
jgi:hypothetical protein